MHQFELGYDRGVVAPYREHNRRVSMRLPALIAAGVTFAAAVPSIAHADPYRWCAEYNTGDWARNCGFVTYQQCMATVSGIGGFCTRNPYYTGREGTNGEGRFRGRGRWRSVASPRR
jgi:hypothetical protein